MKDQIYPCNCKQSQHYLYHVYTMFHYNRFNERGEEAELVKKRNGAHERVTPERTRASCVVEVEMSCAAREQNHSDIRRRRRGLRECIARRRAPMRFERDDFTATPRSRGSTGKRQQCEAQRKNGAPGLRLQRRRRARRG